jgi:hypothetical protein
VPLAEGTHVFGLEPTDDLGRRPVEGRTDATRAALATFAAAAAQEALSRLRDRDIHEGPGWAVLLPVDAWTAEGVVLLGDAAMPSPLRWAWAAPSPWRTLGC